MAPLGVFWLPRLAAVGLILLRPGMPLSQAILSSSQKSFSSAPQSRTARFKLRALTAIVHLL